MDEATACIVRERVERGSNRFWRPADFGSLPARAVDRALSRLASDKELRHIRRGLYWRGSRTPFGMSRPTADQIVEAIAGHVAVGPSGLTAANVLGLTSQVAPVDTIAVASRAPKSLETIRFVSRANRQARVLERLRPLEIAVLEVLADWAELVELDAGTAHSKLAHMFRAGDVRARSMARGAADEPFHVRERLRLILAKADQCDALELVAPARTPDLRRRALEGFDVEGREQRV